MRNLLILLFCVILSACSNNNSADNEPIIDLTVLSSTMVYAEVYNIMESPESYMGKTIKIEGPYYPYYYPETGEHFHFVLIEDAAACCQQGLEFKWKGEHGFPDDYPNEETRIQVEGVLKSYDAFEQTNYYLETDSITVVE